MRVVPIVEGDGEVEAVPVLIRRIGEAVSPLSPPEIAKPIRVRRHRITAEDELKRYVALAASRAGSRGGVLIVLDADDDCPATFAPRMLARARAMRPGIAFEVVLAKSEFEAWLIAAVESIAGQRGIRPDVTAPPAPESIRGAKEWLRAQGSYRPTADQAALTANFDMEVARERSPSFDKMWRATATLLGTAQG